MIDLVRRFLHPPMPFRHSLTSMDLPDPYHTYLSLASLALLRVRGDGFDESWTLPRLDPLLNATEETAKWAREHLCSN